MAARMNSLEESTAMCVCSSLLMFSSQTTPQCDQPLWIKHCQIHDEKTYPFCWIQYLEHVEWLHAEAAFVRQLHWLLGMGGDTELGISLMWALHLTVCTSFTRFFSTDFSSHSRILWQATFVNVAFMKPLVQIWVDIQSCIPALSFFIAPQSDFYQANKSSLQGWRSRLQITVWVEGEVKGQTSFVVLNMSQLWRSPLIRKK